MSDGDVVRKITISANGENIDRTTESVKSLGAANDQAKKSVDSAGSAWVDMAAKVYLAKSAYEGVTTASNNATTSMGRFADAVANGAKSNELASAFSAIWQDGIDKLNTYIDLNKKAGDYGTDLYQRLEKGAASARIPLNDILTMLTNANIALERTFNNTLNDPSTSKFGAAAKNLQNNGNLFGLDVNRVNNSVDPEEQLRNGIVLIQGALDQGAKLAAYKLSDSLFGPEVTARLRLNNDYLVSMVSSIDKVKADELIKQADVDRAVGLKVAIDAAYKTIADRNATAQSDWSQWGIEIQATWVAIVVQYAQSLAWLDKILGRTEDITKETQKQLGLRDYLKGAVDNGHGGTDYTQAPRGSTPSEILASQMQNPDNIKRAGAATQRAGDIAPDYTNANNPTGAAFGPDMPKKIDAVSDAVDRAINGLQKHVLAQKADAEGVGLGAAALAGLKAQAAETAAVLANGGDETDKQKEAFVRLKAEAIATADALAKAQVASDISRGKQLLFATPQDVQIANQLKGIYGDDIPAALNSAEAAALRMNANIKSSIDTLRTSLASGVTDFINGLVKGKSVMESLGAAARNLSTTLTSTAVNNLFSGNWIGAAAAGIGAVVTGIFGASEQEDEDNQKRAKDAADKATKAIQDAADRTKQYNALADSSGFDTSSVLGQIAQFDAQAMQTRADEAEKGNGAIVALENSLAKQRQAIVDKGNQAIAKSMNDFLNSIKTGASSILSPEDQLKYAQSKFSSDVTAGQGGNEDALNRVTADAQNLLDIAKTFYASGTGYATIYQGVTDAITGLASGSNIKVGALAANTAQAPYDATAAAAAAWAAKNKEWSDQAAATATSTPGLADGGYVGNGKYGVDSVMAKFAGGGNIALAGGEHVTRSNSVNASTRPALDYINRTGKAPGGNAELARILTQGFNGQTQVLADKLDALAHSVKQLENTTRQTNNKRRVPGSEKVAA